MTKDTISYGRQSITKEDIEAVVNVLNSDFLTQGPVVKQFEDDFSDYIGCEYSLAVSNGTAGLHLAALALGVKDGDLVLVTSNSFVASANCILYCGGEVELVDTDPESFCIDAKIIEERLAADIDRKIKGIVTVDFAGHPSELIKINKIAKERGLWIIEDACHALGATYTDDQGRSYKCGDGTHADVSIFSFHPVKHIATGEGGMITTNSKDLFEKLSLLRTHGITKNPNQMSEIDGGWYYQMQELGFNYRIPDILCALGTSQLKRMDDNLKARREIADFYDQQIGEKLSEFVKIPKRNEHIDHAFHLYVIQAKNRKELYEFLKTKEIFTQVHYIPIHTQPFYKKRYGEKSLPNVERYYSSALSIPMFHSMTLEQAQSVVDAMVEFYLEK